jgi:hypothetical protein
MGLDNSGQDKQDRKNGFNNQLGFKDFLFFTIKKSSQQTRRNENDQYTHDCKRAIF